MLEKLYQCRFRLLLFAQLFILFGALLFTSDWFESYISPVLFILNLFAGVVLFSANKRKMWSIIVLLCIAIICFGVDISKIKYKELFSALHLMIFFLFYLLLTLETIKQVWNSKEVDKHVIFGLISGYISLGLIGFFICLSIEIAYPNSFSGLIEGISMTENLMYYSYITLLTIGYGDILPISALAHKAAILIGLMGQIYLVVITAIVVGKYINQSSE
ncbi:ion channel [Flavivirga abyssicola]|uniref:ion channel n=1 Tax=Flavivirga abyssicola TaxID=3063533 RepID=UPI0026E086CD|nr:ion channel [Flavivirga sp. MEBiC07777]WVK12386.1 ion channel [Flavivirga sp. MEBiC07777]